MQNQLRHVNRLRDMLAFSFLASLLFWPRYELELDASASEATQEQSFQSLTACRAAARESGFTDYRCLKRTVWNTWFDRGGSSGLSLPKL